MSSSNTGSTWEPRDEFDAKLASLSVPVTGSVKFTLSPANGGDPGTGGYNPADTSGYISVVFGSTEQLNISRVSTFGQNVVYFDVPTGSLQITADAAGQAITLQALGAGSTTGVYGDTVYVGGGTAGVTVVDSVFSTLFSVTSSKITHGKPVFGDTTAGTPFTLGLKSVTLSSAADHAMAADEKGSPQLRYSGTISGDVNVIGPAIDGEVHFVHNSTNHVLTMKASGQTGCTIASGKNAIVVGTGTDYEIMGNGV